ncbi:polymorphic toxin-type HINT domain-containing protein, partial [Micromonospora sp. NPDC057140]
VTATITGTGTKHLVTITTDEAERGDGSQTDGDGDGGHGTTKITATDGHPFWVPELHQWIDATDLQVGQWLQTSAGTRVQITAIQRHATTWATVHNLTIANTHTYYAVVGSEPVLVHNCGTANPDDLIPTHGISGDSSTKRVARYGNDMANGEFDWKQSPIDIVRHEGKMYVVDGHHRLAAARWTRQGEVGIRDVTDQLNNGGFKGYADMADVLDSASRYPGNRLNPHKLKRR